ncbi:MAG TPA: hypothetical protein VMZ27_16145 [Candidatus Saccharimonadales bacterium]|nr:hypothetical protein [Candidatus Saccharimonadales bacterium]
MALVLSILATAGIVLMVFYFCTLLLGEGEWSLKQLKEVTGSAARAIFFPITVWVLIHCGLFPGVPILSRRIALAQAAGKGWAGMMLDSTAVALFVIVTYWSGLMLVWLLVRAYRSCGDGKEFKATAFFWAGLLFPFAAALGWFAGPALTGAMLTLWMVPVIHLAAPLLRVQRLPPSYSKATALLKQGKYNQAEWEVIRALENHENDFQGWMMLAELYAVHFGDVASAEQTIYDLCSQPEINPSQICTAIYKLSEWHLKVAEDPLAAREVIEVICKKWPGTQLDKMARARIQQLPDSREELQRRQQPHRVRLPTLRDEPETCAPEPLRGGSRDQAARQANLLVEKLVIDSNDAAVREEFARILAEQLGKGAEAIEQLELLLAMPDQDEKKRAEWLGSIASWQFKYERNPEAGKASLRRLVAEFPQSVQAFTAQRRLNLMQIEERMKRNRVRETIPHLA